MKAPACVLIAAALAVLCLCTSPAPAQTAPVIPSWIHAGSSVIYDTVSAFIANGRYNQSIRMVVFTRVNSVSNGVVYGVTQTQTVGSPIGGTHQWACNAAGNCKGDASGLNGQFWVDPANPVASLKGAHGEQFSLGSAAPYSYGGNTWTANTLTYSNPDAGVKVTTTFDTKSGLVLAHAEYSPAEEVHAYFRSMK